MCILVVWTWPRPLFGSVMIDSQLLIEHKVPAIALWALLDMYERQSMRTMWKEEFSELFTTKNGIRQDVVISPVLVCIYALLNRLERESYGCWIGNHYFGSVRYCWWPEAPIYKCSWTSKADRGLCRVWWRIWCSVQPSKDCILYSKKDTGQTPRIELCVTALQWVDTVKHLGNYLDANMKEETEIRRKKGDLMQRVNNMLVSIGKS